LANSNYPEHKKQLKSLEDSSENDTWYWLRNPKKKLGERLEIHKQARKQGKCQTLYREFNRATDGIYITVDSD
jgi:hyaluronan synthase